jgi:hypothetical protein
MRCESIHIGVDDSQLGIEPSAGVHRELCDQFIASCNGKHPWLTKAIVCKVREIEHHDVVSSEVFANEFCDKCPQEWTKQALQTLEEAMKSHMVEIIPRCHFRSSNEFLGGFQYVSYYGKTRRSGTACTVRHASRLEYGQTGHRSVFMRRNRVYATTDQ